MSSCDLGPSLFLGERIPLSRIPTTTSATPASRLHRDLDRFALYSIDLQLMDLMSDPNPDQQTKTSMSGYRPAVSFNLSNAVKAAGQIATAGYLNRREPVLGFRSSPLTTSHIGVENMRQIRSSVRNVIGFPASTFCQYLTEYPCESMSSWLSPASSRKRLIRAPKPLKNWDSSRMIPFFKLHALKRTRPI